MLARTLPVAPGCNKVSENEKTSGNRIICGQDGISPWYWKHFLCQEVWRNEEMVTIYKIRS
jgi:hypothetical protein